MPGYLDLWFNLSQELMPREVAGLSKVTESVSETERKLGFFTVVNIMYPFSNVYKEALDETTGIKINCNQLSNISASAITLNVEISK